jgi:hypothetical protein
MKLGPKTYFTEPYQKCIAQIKTLIKTQNLVIALENYGIQSTDDIYDEYKQLIALFILQQAVINAKQTKMKRLEKMKQKNN